MSLKIYTLGSLQLQYDGEAVMGLVSNKAAVLLLYLAWHPYPHPREILADLFWHDTEAQQAMTNLRNALSSLQKHLGPYLDVTRQTIGINLDSPFWIDAHAFSQSIKKYKDINQDRPKPSQKMIENLEQAVKLYKGDFLLGLNLKNSIDVENWILSEQRHLRSSYVDSLNYLASHYLNIKNYEKSVSISKEIITADPWWEKGYQLLMTSLALSGRRHEALQQYKFFSDFLEEELDITPDDETSELYELIKKGKLSEAYSAIHDDLVLPTSRNFVGRAEEINKILANLDNPSCRLMSIVGIGGIGKTQLALETAHRCSNDYRDGVLYLALSPDSEDNDIIDKIGTSLKFHPMQESLKQAIIDHFYDKHLLFVIDNAEHFLGQIGFLNELLLHARHLKILVTSREVLNLQGEWIIKLDGLPIPSLDMMPETAVAYDSIKLFQSIATQSLQSFRIEENIKEVIQICQIVGGSPLAIQIAASWVQILSVPQILEKIRETLGFLSSFSRDIPERQRSIHAVLDNSWDLLSESEQNVLMSLSVFQGSFSQEAAEFIADADISHFGQLANKSLILHSPQNKFILHDLIRQHAYEKLNNSDLLEKVSFRHCEYFLQSLQKLKILSEKKSISFEELDNLYDDILHALLWTDQQHMIVFICSVFQRQEWKIRQILKNEFEPKLIAYAQTKDYPHELYAAYLFNQADFLWIMGETEEAIALLKENLALCERENWIEFQLETLALLIEIAAFTENYLEVLDYLQPFLNFKNHPATRHLLSHVLYCLGASFLGFKRGTSDFFSAQFYTLIQFPSYSIELYKTLVDLGFSNLTTEAIQLDIRYLNQSAEILEQKYYTYDPLALLSDFTQIGLLSEKFYQVERLIFDSLKIGKLNKNTFQILYALLGYSNLLILQSDYEKAAILHGFINKFSLKQQLENHRYFLQSQLGEASYKEFYCQGEKMTMVEALQFVIPTDLHVFIIDDDINDRKILGQLLELENVTYSLASSSEEALEKIDQLPELSAIFLDIKMPEVDGYSLFKILKVNSHIQNVPIIAYTGNPQDAKKAYDMGFHGLLAKPINISDFHEDLNNILQGNRFW